MNWIELRFPIRHADHWRPNGPAPDEWPGLCRLVGAALGDDVPRFAVHIVPGDKRKRRSGPSKMHMLTVAIPRVDQGRVDSAGEKIGLALVSAGSKWRISGVATCSAHTVHETRASNSLWQRKSAHADLRLEFITPCRVHDTNRHGTSPQTARFLATVLDRCHRLLRWQPKLPDTIDSLRVISHFSSSTRAPTSNFQSRGVSGAASGAGPDLLRGPILLRNPSRELVHALCVLEALHLDGKGATSWHGLFRLRWQDRPMLDGQVARLGALVDITEQTLRNNDTRPEVDAAGAVLESDALAAGIAARLSAGTYTWSPAQAFAIRKNSGGTRTVERLETRDLIVQRRLLQILTPIVERLLSDSVTGFRPRRGREDAVAMIRRAIGDGFRYVVESDIEDFFPSIPHARLIAEIEDLLPLSDQLIRSLLRAAISQPVLLDDTVRQRTRGVAQGAPLSPLLANLYLSKVDLALDEKRFRYVRYSDDVLILCRSANDAKEALARLEREVGAAGLALSLPKTRITAVESGFDFLGEHFDQKQVEDPVSAILPQRKPLVVTEPYVQLGVNGEALEARRDNRVIATWPIRRLSEVILLSRANLSTALMQQCAKHGVPLAIALPGGKSLVTLRPQNRSFHRIAYAHGRWYEQLTAGERLAFAQEVVRAKLNNYAAFVQQRSNRCQTHERLLHAHQACAGALNTEQLRGIEGSSARAIFAWLQEQIVPAARAAFQARRRERGAHDRLNSALNFSYFLLFSRMNAYVRTHGLNPYLGWLHDGEDDYETLVYDLMEPFRPFVDRMVIRLINRQDLRPASFGEGEQEFWLRREGSQRVVQAFEQTMREPIGPTVLAEVMLAQVRALRQLMRGEGPFWLFRWAPRRPKGEAPDGLPDSLDPEEKDRA